MQSLYKLPALLLCIMHEARVIVATGNNMCSGQTRQIKHQLLTLTTILAQLSGFLYKPAGVDALLK